MPRWKLLACLAAGLMIGAALLPASAADAETLTCAEINGAATMSLTLDRARAVSADLTSMIERSRVAAHASGSALAIAGGVAPSSVGSYLPQLVQNDDAQMRQAVLKTCADQPAKVISDQSLTQSWSKVIGGDPPRPAGASTTGH